ncbi:MAG: hypothetical protein H6617_04900 [Bdellovibrionaceae bacterium]|nr:hypothetical protein [Bdellovibrionales bacterium]MCB9254001.1 hypothetical protein [Pseudobdellovibrionaceae bacterium]
MKIFYSRLGLIGLWAALGVTPWCQAKQEVRVGAYINDIQNLDLSSHSYSVDLYVWFRWREKDSNPPASVEFNNPYELWGHVRTAEYETPFLMPNGDYYQVIRDQGRFSKKLILDNYPFDKQILEVAFEDSELGSDERIFVADENPITINPELKLPGFVIGKPSMSFHERAYPTGFGFGKNPMQSHYSRVLIEIPIKRPIVTYAVKLMLPVLCVIFCASLMFLFNPTYVDSRVGIGITALLTIVALQITLNEDLPEIDYLVLIDKVYLLAYLFVIAGLGVVVKTTWMLEKGNVEAAIRFDRIALMGLASLFAFAIALTLFLSKL